MNEEMILLFYAPILNRSLEIRECLDTTNKLIMDINRDSRAFTSDKISDSAALNSLKEYSKEREFICPSGNKKTLERGYNLTFVKGLTDFSNFFSRLFSLISLKGLRWTYKFSLLPMRRRMCYGS